MGVALTASAQKVKLDVVLAAAVMVKFLQLAPVEALLDQKRRHCLHQGFQSPPVAAVAQSAPQAARLVWQNVTREQDGPPQPLAYTSERGHAFIDAGNGRDLEPLRFLPLLPHGLSYSVQWRQMYDLYIVKDG